MWRQSFNANAVRGATEWRFRVTDTGCVTAGGAIAAWARPIMGMAIVCTMAITWAGGMNAAQAQDEILPDSDGPAPAYFVRVPLPIVGNTDVHAKQAVETILANSGGMRKRPILVIEFWPSTEDASSGAGSQFERSYALANFLSGPRLDRVRTVAYLPRTVVGHAILPVMACEEIVMSPKAKLGDAGRGLDSITMTMRGAYREIANRRRTVPEAIALAMLDQQQKLWKLTTPEGQRFALDGNVDDLQEKLTINSMDSLVDVDAPAFFSGNQLRNECNVVTHLVRNRVELGEALGVRVTDLEPDPSSGREWVAIQVDLVGWISVQNVQRVQRMIENALQKGDVNFVCLRIDSPGGKPVASVQLAAYLAGLDSSRVRTVAYVEEEARSDAAIIALACDHLVMQHLAVLGGPGAYEPNENELQDAQLAIQDIAKTKMRHWSVPAGMLDPQWELYKYKLTGTALTECLTPQEVKQLDEPDRWQQADLVCPKDTRLALTGDETAKLKISRFVVADFAELKAVYQLTDHPTLVEPNWAHEIIAYLADPQVTAGLLFVAMLALMAEIASPGLGLGGFVASVCFLLFFWSHFLNGTANWLEVILFLSGLVFVALEIFVIPGFGIFGLGGGAMVILSIILASQTFVIPRNSYQMDQLPNSLFTLAAAGGGLCLGILWIGRYIDRVPLLRRMMLHPPKQDELEAREAIVDYSDLLHQCGKAATPLLPGGRAQIADRLINVVTEGCPIDEGSPVQVVQVQGNRVVVRQLTNGR